jgi:hypothetical protein
VWCLDNLQRFYLTAEFYENTLIVSTVVRRETDGQADRVVMS